MDKDIRKVVTRLSEANLTITTEKSKFCQREIKYLGHILSDNGRRSDQAPTRIREVQQFMEMATFYSRYIENFGGIIAPISDLLKGEKIYLMACQIYFVILR
jgi:hypothetical protein